MRISIDWIHDFVSLPKKSAQELANDLTLKVVEVEDAIDQQTSLDHVVVGVIDTLSAHPQADKLTLCSVDIGTGHVPVVCGGSNLRAGMKVALACVGATVRWHGEGELIELKETKIRGERSEGMICAAEEIGLGELFPKAGEREILDISFVDAHAGTPIAQALGMTDILLDIDNKSMTHRPDLWGHYGMAREFAAIYQQPLKNYDARPIKPGKEARLSVSVDDHALCPRYMGVMLSGVTVLPSPEWMQKRLVAVGIRPINTIVDITNYVMFELGQPMHAFDAARISKQQSGTTSITVRLAKKQETITLLGDEQITLSEHMLVIADEEKALAIAGVKGGADSSVTNETVDVLFEAANFHPLSVRRTAAALGIRTDASSRFEKNLDPTLPEIALRRAVELTQQLCPQARVVSTVADEKEFSLALGPITIDCARICSRIGVSLSPAEIVAMLERLGFTVKEKNGVLSVMIPSWRATGDIAIPEDLIEEIARLYGYGEIPTTFPEFPIVPAPRSPLRDLEKRIKELLVYEEGYTEVYNYSFVSPDWLATLGVSVSDHIELTNPLAKDRPFVRRSLIPNMLNNVEMNLHRFDHVQLCETGRGYKKEQAGPQAHPNEPALLPGQDVYLGLAYARKGISTPFFCLSAALLNIADRLGIDITVQAAEQPEPYIHPGRQADIRVGATVIGWIGELHPATQMAAGISERTAVAELNLSVLQPLVGERIRYTPLPVFPSVVRDIAIMVDQQITHAAIMTHIQQCSPGIRAVALFDVYQGEHIAEGKKSMAYHIDYRSDEKTLTTQEVDELHARVLRSLQKTFGATIR